MLLTTGDAAIVNAPVTPGRRFTVVRADRRVFHPLTGQYLGWLTAGLGTAEVTCRGERTSTVVLHGMRDAAGVGDYLVPFDPNDVLEENVLPGKISRGASRRPADAVIVAFDEDRLAVGEQELAYIDRGTASGVAPGQALHVYRRDLPGRPWRSASCRCCARASGRRRPSSRPASGRCRSADFLRAR